MPRESELQVYFVNRAQIAEIVEAQMTLHRVLLRNLTEANAWAG